MFVRTIVGISLVTSCLVAGCATETSPAPDPSSSAKLDEGPSVDESQLGDVCGFDAGACAAGELCATYPGLSEPRCGPTNGCSLVTCPAGEGCTTAGSWPARVRCSPM